jgi:uncharacterized membrane protein
MAGRDDILDWAEQGRIAPENLREALRVSGALPGAAAWRLFIDRLLLWVGTVMLGAALVFFLAYNWQDLGRFAKFALAEAALLLALGAVARTGLERTSGKAALLAAALFTGALLALIGQTYQTGADPFELFAAWALAILPWALVGRSATLWLLWIALVNLSATLYFQAFNGLFGFVFGPERQLWLLFGLNSVALAAWEAAASSGAPWLASRWPARVLATASGGLITALAVMSIFEWRVEPALAMTLLAVWLASGYALYRRRVPDVFILAGGMLSVITVTTAFLGKHLMRHDAASASLFIGVVVIGLSAAGGWWLKQVAQEQST